MNSWVTFVFKIIFPDGHYVKCYPQQVIIIIDSKINSK